MNLEIKQTANGYIGKVSGRLDTAASQQFAIDIDPLLENADKRIILDCSGLEFISSSGLRLFLSLRKATIAKGGSVTIVGVTDAVRQVFTITGFYSLFKFEEKQGDDSAGQGYY